MRLILKHQQANGKGTGVIQKNSEYSDEVRDKLFNYYDLNWQYDTGKEKWTTPETYALDEGDPYRSRWDLFYGPIYDKLDSLRLISHNYYDDHAIFEDLERLPNKIGFYASELGALLIPNDTLFGREIPDLSNPELKTKVALFLNRVNALNVAKVKKALDKLDKNRHSFSYYDLFKLAKAAGVNLLDLKLAYDFDKEGQKQYEQGVTF